MKCQSWSTSWVLGGILTVSSICHSFNSYNLYPTQDNILRIIPGAFLCGFQGTLNEFSIENCTEAPCVLWNDQPLNVNLVFSPARQHSNLRWSVSLEIEEVAYVLRNISVQNDFAPDKQYHLFDNIQHVSSQTGTCFVIFHLYDDDGQHENICVGIEVIFKESWRWTD